MTERQVTDEQILTVLRGNGEVTIDLDHSGRGYAMMFTSDQIHVMSECCSSQPSLDEAQRIYQAWGVWLQLQEGEAL